LSWLFFDIKTGHFLVPPATNLIFFLWPLRISSLFFFLWEWGLNSGLCTCKAGTLLLKQ
jgi:hypothetical protein